jgi:hypothetical protein
MMIGLSSVAAGTCSLTVSTIVLLLTSTALTCTDAFTHVAITTTTTQIKCTADCTTSTHYSTLRTSTRKAAASENEASGVAPNTSAQSTESSLPPLILDPFLPAADPNYKNQGPVGQGEFVITRTGGPRAEELTNENILLIVDVPPYRSSDLEVNTLVWKCLGYRFDSEKQVWTADECFPKWKEQYPEPPDLIGMQRIYSKQVDMPSLRSNQALIRSIPAEYKQSLKKHMQPLGWSGYKLKDLIPNKTRRAQCANWLLYYREEMFGYTVEELRERRRLKQEAAEKEAAASRKDAGEEEWKPPVKEVF